ncbi:MAG: hypothetical protein DWQ36_21350 [Acidobacteria bacterium]|nr:MAG: hypothetical protein DWQ30_09700 [Acidobacteriota bacterium]REK01054.1 MAG: hypothetical protein DWQ36_21350 [Acidobacteriota bacterium]
MKEPKVVKELLATVETLRDEMRVQANLASKDARDELHRLEERWKSLDRERRRVAEVVEETAEESWAGMRMALEELRDGYRRLRKG